MTLDWSVNSEMGLDDCPYKMFDGRGTEIRLPVEWCDTETGEIRFSVRGYAKQFYEGRDGELLTANTFLKPPLTVFDCNGRDITCTTNPTS